MNSSNKKKFNRRDPCLVKAITGQIKENGRGKRSIFFFFFFFAATVVTDGESLESHRLNKNGFVFVEMMTIVSWNQIIVCLLSLLLCCVTKDADSFLCLFLCKHEKYGTAAATTKVDARLLHNMCSSTSSSQQTQFSRKEITENRSNSSCRLLLPRRM
jgi:hypothetical protein